MVHPEQRKVSEHRSPESTPPLTCKQQVQYRATCGKAWKPTSNGWRKLHRIAGTMQKISSVLEVLRYPLFPDKGFGVNFYYTPSSEIGIWPYWISAGGWCMRQFWDQYLVTGDMEFLRNRVVPAYKELAQFYEDFLTVTDKDGNYIFVPSISPENTSRSTDPVRTCADQCHYGHRSVPGSTDQFNPGL